MKCAFYFSIENGVSSDNENTCKSGYVKDEICREAPR